MIKKDLSVLSSDGINTLRGVVYQPDGEPKGLFHVVHGMTEHIGRYDRFMTDMAEKGWLCFGYDNLGHGNTAKECDLGYIAKADGWDLLARDVKEFSDAVKSEYSKDVPYVLMGHSMGSFIVRVAAEKYVSPDKLVIMGTGGPNPIAGVGLTLIKIIKLFRGERHISPFVDNIAFGTYNDRFPEVCESDPSPWLTNDKTVRERYYADRFCTFKFTVSAMADLIRLIMESNRDEWYKNISSSMPILLVSGREDPVGNYGAGVADVFERLKKEDKLAECLLYDGARHEILNDFTYGKVVDDIEAFSTGK